MPSYFDSWWGLQTNVGISVEDATLTITDGDISVDFTEVEGGWFLLGPDGWTPVLSEFSGGGTYLKSDLVDGQFLKYAAFDNVQEAWRVGLNWHSSDDLVQRIDELSELLKVRAPKYWQDRTYNKPVYIIRRLAGEASLGYALLSQGSIQLPSDFWDITCNLLQGQTWPIQIVLQRQPFWHGAAPGQVQGTVELAAQQQWAFNLVWTQESSLPSGQVFCLVETIAGVIYAGGASEILTYSGGSWSVVNTSPVTLSADVTSAVVLADGDVLFGESGRIIKLAGGVWSVETAEPSGAVTALLEANDSSVYAGDNGRIVKRDVNGVWAEDDDLPDGQVYALFQTSAGRLLAGEPGRILQTRDISTSVRLSVKIIDGNDDAEQFDSGSISLNSSDLDFFQSNYAYIGVRFQNVTIPAGATINSAVVRFTAEDTDINTPGAGTLYGEDADNAGAFTTATNNLSNRTATTATVSWSNEQDWISNLAYDTPELLTVVQEQVDRVGWSSGNALVILFQRTSTGADRDAWTYNGRPGSAAELIVTYSEAHAGGETWEISTTLPAGDVRCFLQISDRILAGENSQFLASHDDARSWKVLDTSPTGVVRSLVEAGDLLYAGEAGSGGPILRSGDRGSNWVVDDNSTATGDVAALLYGSDSTVRAGDNGFILQLDRSDILNLGQAATDLNQVFVANHHKTANLTHVIIDDGGVFSNIFPTSTFPTALLPAVPAVNDAIYFGIDTSLTDTGPMAGLVFDIATPASSTTSYTIVWEYYNGSWTTLTVQDGTNQLSEVGVNSVHCAMPSDWTSVTVDSISGWFFRARLSALTGTLTPPTQQNRDVYSPATAFIEIAANQTVGTINALAKLQLNNRAAGGGPGGSSPPLYFNRLLAGVKAVENHTNFRAFLNFSDEQNPDGISLDVSVDGDSATALQTDSSLSSISGKRVFFDASLAEAGAGLDNLADRVALILDTTIARDYYGSYKIFLRGKQSGGNAGDITLRLKATSGSGGITELTDVQATLGTNDHHLLEFEQPLTLPVSSLFTEMDIGDQTTLTIQISSASSSADFYLYDLFLLPVGISFVDAVDRTNSANSSVDDTGRLLVDSITVPKTPIRTLAQQVASDLFTASWGVDSNGPFTLLKVQQHRVWILTARTASAGSAVWLSEPEGCVSCRAWKVDRWLLGRGLA